MIARWSWDDNDGCHPEIGRSDLPGNKGETSRALCRERSIKVSAEKARLATRQKTLPNSLSSPRANGAWKRLEKTGPAATADLNTALCPPRAIVVNRLRARLVAQQLADWESSDLKGSNLGSSLVWVKGEWWAKSKH
jgi:hypothetical protein